MKFLIYSKKLEDMKVQCSNTLSRLNQLISRNDELVKEGAAKDEKINSLNIISQQKDDEVRFFIEILS